jgi:hypothetical protein
MKLFNMTENKRQFSREWKTALIQPFYKGKGNQREPGNCRGIALLLTLGKIYSEVTVRQLRH